MIINVNCGGSGTSLLNQWSQISTVGSSSVVPGWVSGVPAIDLCTSQLTASAGGPHTLT